MQLETSLQNIVATPAAGSSNSRVCPRQFYFFSKESSHRTAAIVTRDRVENLNHIFISLRPDFLTVDFFSSL